MVNSPKEIYIEIDGQLIKDESVSFINDEHIIRTIERMIGPMGRTIDATNPMVDSRLKMVLVLMLLFRLYLRKDLLLPFVNLKKNDKCR